MCFRALRILQHGGNYHTRDYYCRRITRDMWKPTKFDALSPITFPIHIKRIVTANKQNWEEYKKRPSNGNKTAIKYIMFLYRARILSSSFFTLSGGVAKAQVVIVWGKRPVTELKVFLQHLVFWIQIFLLSYGNMLLKFLYHSRIV